ncbi:hypothetical protein Tco_0424795 [Tanacetum coccineum]
MKTKRNLVPKTTVVGNSSGIGQGNVVVPDLRENVCGVSSSNSPKRQCVRQGNVVVRDLHENGYGVDVCGVGSSSSQKRQCVPGVPPAFGDGLVSWEDVRDDISYLFRRDPTCGCDISNSRQYGDGLPAVYIDASPNQLGFRTQQPAILVFTNSVDAFSNTNTQSHITEESTISGNNLERQPRASGPSSNYKHIGSCTYSFQYCGAMF